MVFRFPLYLLVLTAGFSCTKTFADDTPPETAFPSPPSNDAPIKLERFVVTGELDRAREAIVPSLGASQFQISRDQILAEAGGGNASFNNVLLRAPGMAQDSFGQLHLRGEHANMQYRINDILLPEGASGFGQELDTRFVDTVAVLTGSLPAQYGYRTAGVIDIHTKNGANADGGSVTLNGGSFNSARSAFELGGTNGHLDYYVTGSYFQSDLGIENPTDQRSAIHDHTRQLKGFGYFSYLIDSTSRLALIVSGSGGEFQIPNSPNQTPAFTLAGVPTFDSAKLEENQRENNGYATVSYQKSTADAGVQVAAFTRTSDIKFTPDAAGDLIFNGIASAVQRNILSNGIEADGRWAVLVDHTFRGGFILTTDRTKVDTTDQVFAVDADGNQTSSTPVSIGDNQSKRGSLYGIYLQDEWTAVDKLTVNFGFRADVSDGYVRESQLSPRVNFVYAATESTNLHAGYARYFTPPPLELVSSEAIAKFANTSNAPEVTTSSPVRSERAHYFDLGVTQNFTKAWSVGLDGYYKTAKNQLDEGQFGRALVFSPFNYRTGKIYGVELSTNITAGAFTAYANLAISKATGREIVSGEFQFGQDELNYMATHDVALDHDQRYTSSVGVTYKRKNTLVYADMLYGSGLRRGFANTATLPAYTTANLGVDQKIALNGKQELHLRIDGVNLFDKVYELRDGSGIGVGAPQFGARRGVYGSVTWAF
jgi:outer membrane receptor for ferrienterochelin and colicin